MLNIINVGYDSANYYVIDAGASKLLVDVGWPGTVPRLHAALRRVGVPPDSITHLLATHYHPDHAGAAQELKTRGVWLIVLENQVAGIVAFNGWMEPRYHPVPISLDDNLNVRSAESRAFLQRLGLEGEIVITPGHSDDSVSLILDEGVAFTGDLPPPGIFAPEHPAEVSWALLRAHGVRTVYPAHGPTRSLA